MGKKKNHNPDTKGQIPYDPTFMRCLRQSDLEGRKAERQPPGVGVRRKNGESACHGCMASRGADEKFLETDEDDGCTTECTLRWLTW